MRLRMLLAVCAVTVLATTSHAAVPTSITVQGRVTDASDNPLPAGAKSFVFRIFDASVGGIEIWPGGAGEMQTITTSSDGLWIGLVGAITPLTDVVFTDTLRWLQITVTGTTLPRVRLVTGPFAYRVATVDGATGGTITSKVSIGPGHTNTGLDAFAVGTGNTASGQGAHAAGGFADATGDWSTVGGGFDNTASAHRATVGGGQWNVASGNTSTIAGGLANLATGLYAAVGGGEENIGSGTSSTVGGGYADTASGSYATIPGGFQNRAGGEYSFAAGRRAKALHLGTFVWAAGVSPDFTSTGNSQFLIRASGGVGIGTNSPQQQLSVSDGMNIDQDDANFGTVANSLRFGSNGGEAIASKRTATGNQFGLDFYTNSLNRMSITFGGLVGIGTTAPEKAMHVQDDSSGGLAYALKLSNESPATNGTTTGILFQVDDGPARGKGGLVYERTTTWNRGDFHFLQNAVEGNPVNAGLSDKVFTIRNDGNVGIKNSSPGNILTVQQGSATDPVADAWGVYSSRRWKEDIVPIKDALDKVERLQGVTYKWKADGKHDIGLIAEDVGKVIPEVVAYEENEVDAQSVDYARLVALLIEGMKEQQKQIDVLKSRLDRQTP